jgi:hypothetical protein
VVSSSGKDVDLTATTAGANNLHQSLFSQCNVSLNGKAVSQANEHYNYRSYLETLLTYGTDAATYHLTNTYWYLDTDEMQPCDPMAEIHTATKNEGLIARWIRLSENRYVQIFDRLHTDLCNCRFLCSLASNCR